ncbi:MAG: L,D-transpeptidase family protein [Porphyrobacter sp.]|nr:L,D-transpeptidase family protein [Porphyrobacter sp.]
MIRMPVFVVACVGLIGSVSLAAMPLGARPQPSPAEAAQAAGAAETVANRAQNAIERVDPTTLGPSQVLNPSLSDPYAVALALPTGNLLDDEVTYADAPRGPAVRMIPREMVPAQPELADVAPVPAPLPEVPAAEMVAAEMSPAQMAPVTTTPVAQPPAPRARTARGKEPFVVKSILPIEGAIRYGDWFWDESNAPATGTLVITIDLEARVLSVFRDGHEIGTTVALLGTPSHPTPVGTFPVLDKNREYFSRKYNNAPMPFSLWLTRTGIAIHGSPVTNGYASHGCVGVPDPFAEKLFAATKRGDKVIITKGRMIGVGDKVI